MLSGFFLAEQCYVGSTADHLDKAGEGQKVGGDGT